MSVRTILIVEDEQAVRDVLEYSLTQDGYRVTAAVAIAAAEEILRLEPPEAVLLDLNLPGGNGLDLLRSIRRKSSLPVIILSSRDDDADIITGLELGADDYMTKPFNPRELTARLRAVLRRTSGEWIGGSSVKRGALRIEVDRHEVFWNEERIRLTVSELAILAALAGQPERVHTREMLLRAIHGFEPASSDRVVDTHVKEIRRKLHAVDRDADPIETVPTLGYRIR